MIEYKRLCRAQGVPGAAIEPSLGPASDLFSELVKLQRRFLGKAALTFLMHTRTVYNVHVRDLPGLKPKVSAAAQA